MFTRFSIKTLLKTERCLIRTFQNLSLLHKGPATNAFKLEESPTSLQQVNNDVTIDEKVPYIKPKTISSSYINESEILKELFKLNVDLYKIERNKKAYEYILQRKFEDIKEHIIFLKELNLETTDIGKIITENPLILKDDVEDLKVRINYLQYKKFTADMITAIVKKNPFWLSHSTQNVDECLGSIQNLLSLEGHEVRKLATINAKIITYSLVKLKNNIFTLKEEMGFSVDEIKQIALQRPKLLMNGRTELLKTFDFLHNVMNVPHNRIIQECGILGCRESRLKQRHLFLEKLGKVQYDPKKPNYISLTNLVSGTDDSFCTNIAKSSVDAFNLFLKSL